jgi:serine phosphatase RsbU (regulator of sigma subunit)
VPKNTEFPGTLTTPLFYRIRRIFEPGAARTPARTDPLHCDVPALNDAEIAATYYGQRMAGDFYEFLRVGPSRVVFGLFDMAGRRDDTREILTAAQATFRTLAPRLLAAREVNESEAMIELSQRVNCTILQFGGVRSCPAFLGCYHEDVGTVCYANAGHTPALLRDTTGIVCLEANGLPLGLFSHTTRSASTVALMEGAVLLVVSRGIVEAEYNGEEFGLKNVSLALQHAPALNARDLCSAVLQASEQFMRRPPHDDITALALLRKPRRGSI